MVHGGALAGWAVLPALRLSQYPVRHRARELDTHFLVRRCSDRLAEDGSRTVASITLPPWRSCNGTPCAGKSRH